MSRRWMHRKCDSETVEVQQMYLQMSLSLLFLVLLLRLISNRLISLDKSLKEHKNTFWKSARNNNKKKNKNTHPNVKDSLKDELLGEDGVLSLPRVCLGHLNTVQVDVTVGIGEILGWQLVSLLHVQHQAAHLRKHKHTYIHTYIGMSWAHTKLYLFGNNMHHFRVSHACHVRVDRLLFKLFRGYLQVKSFTERSSTALVYILQDLITYCFPWFT